MNLGPSQAPSAESLPGVCTAGRREEGLWEGLQLPCPVRGLLLGAALALWDLGPLGSSEFGRWALCPSWGSRSKGKLTRSGGRLSLAVMVLESTLSLSLSAWGAGALAHRGTDTSKYPERGLAWPRQPAHRPMHQARPLG